MIKKKIENEDFTLELTVNFKDPRFDEVYDHGVKAVTCLLAGALSSGQLFSLFMDEIVKVTGKMLVAAQVEEALSKPSGS